MNEPIFARWQRQHLMHCWSSQRNYRPIPVEGAEGCWSHTSDGCRIFDLRSAHECISPGFNRPKIRAALKAQLDKLIYVTDDFATETTGRLVQRLAELTPGSSEKRIFLAQSGAAALETAVKAARLYQYNRLFHGGERHSVDAPGQYPYPYKIISRYKSWHGSTSGDSSFSGDPRR